MRIWVVCFILLFGASELLQWVRQFSLPLPIFVLGGIFLAVASNYDKLKNLPFHLDHEEPDQLSEDAAIDSLQPPSQPASVAKPFERSISFTIQKPFQPGD